MKQRDKIVLGVVLAVVVGGAVLLLTCMKCALPPAPPTGVAPKEPLTEDIVGERMDDPVYVEALKGLIDQRSEVIAEARAVRRQMEELLAAAEKVAGASSSGADDAQPNRELEAPATMEAPATLADTPAVSTNTAWTAGTVVYAPPTPPTADLIGIPPSLLAYVRQLPEWGELEMRLNSLASRQQEIQINTKTLIRERMEVQYAARAAEQTTPMITPPERVIKPMTNAPDFYQTEPIVITNVPAGGMKLPPLPDRKPVK